MKTEQITRQNKVINFLKGTRRCFICFKLELLDLVFPFSESHQTPVVKREWKQQQ